MSSMTSTVLKELISQNKVMVFSKSYCPYCSKAKNLFNELKVPFKVFELDQEASGAEIHKGLIEFTGQRTVPNIFINAKHVGGCDRVVELNQNGQLMSLINEGN